MAYEANELFGTVTRGVEQLRVEPREIQPKTFAPVSGGATLARLTPVAFDTTLSKWVVWSAIVREEEVQTITIDATGGTFTVTFDGETTGALAWNISAANLLAALEGLSSLQAGDITVTLDTLVYTITFLGTGRYGYVDVPAITTNPASLTGGGGTAAVAEGNKGVADTGRNDIRGFVWPNAVTVDDSGDGNEDVIGQVLLAGRIHYDDIVLPSGESATNLKAALRSGCRERGLWIEGLAQVR